MRINLTVRHSGSAVSTAPSESNAIGGFGPPAGRAACPLVFGPLSLARGTSPREDR